MMQKILIVLSGILLVSCAGKQPEPLPIRDLMAEVCTEGEGRKSKIYVKNTGPESWQNVEISVTKGGREYGLGLNPLSARRHSDRLKLWPPESEIKSEPILNATDFVFRGISSDPKDPLYAQGQVPLTNFGYLENAKVETDLPTPGIWMGDVTVCKNSLSVR